MNENEQSSPIQLPPGRSRPIGWLLRIVGRLVVIVGVIFLLIGLGLWEENGQSDNNGGRTVSNPSGLEVHNTDVRVVAALMIVGAITATIGTLTIIRGRRHLVLSADELLARDKRPPVVYLRSFRSDSPMAHRSMTDVAQVASVRPSIEEKLVKVLQSYGPVVALGEPGERVPPLGAARDYVSNDVWKARVSEWLQRACMIVLLVGQTDAFFWEVERVAALQHPERLVFILLNDSAIYAPFREQFEQHFATSIPDGIPGMSAAHPNRLAESEATKIWGVLALDSQGSWGVKRVQVFKDGEIAWTQTLLRR